MTGTPSSRPATTSPRVRGNASRPETGKVGEGDADGVGDRVGEAAEAGAEDEADGIGQVAAARMIAAARSASPLIGLVQREGAGQQFAMSDRSCRRRRDR